MEGNDTSMLILVAFVFISILAVLVLAVVIGALYLIVKMYSRVFTNLQPPRQLVTKYPHSQFPQEATRRNSVNLIASAYNQRRPQENDERF